MGLFKDNTVFKRDVSLLVSNSGVSRGVLSDTIEVLAEIHGVRFSSDSAWKVAKFAEIDPSISKALIDKLPDRQLGRRIYYALWAALVLAFSLATVFVADWVL